MKNDFGVKNKKGTITLLVLVFSGIMILLFGGMVGFIFVQHHAQVKKIDKEKSLQIAEAGLDYYKWFLSHYPGDLQDGTGLPGPYEHEYYDPEGGAIGKFSLEVTGLSQCGSISAINIISTGWTYDSPNIKKTLLARYARPSLAKYVFVSDTNVWWGVGETLNGLSHNNGGIHMDGEHNSLVTSAKTTWNCTSSFGCSGIQVKPGIFGNGGNPELWQFPVEPIDFVGISADLLSMKNAAQSFGIYLPKSTDIKPSGKGYYVHFKNDGTFDVDIVTSVNGKNILNKIFHQTYTLPASCGLVFFEDNVWVDGIVKGKQTVVSANLIDASVDTDVILRDSIEYTIKDGSDGLLLIAEKNMVIPSFSPNILKMDGIYVAQKGQFYRPYYSSNVRDKIEIYGSIISKGQEITTWWSGGVVVSGYKTTERMSDSKLMFDPPPMTPYADDEYSFIKWEEEN